MDKPLNPVCERRFSKIEAALEDNGAWGIKTKVAKLWDWWNHQKGKKEKLILLNVLALFFSALSSVSGLVIGILALLK